MKTKINNLLFYSSIMLLILSFDLAHNTQSGWQKQELPDLGGRAISDMFFLDSLTGWAVTPNSGLNDTAYIIKSLNGGANWNIIHTRTGAVGFKRIHFLNYATGFACGSNSPGHFTGLSKSTDGGFNWQSLNVPDPFVQFDDMSVLNEDTIWLTASSPSTGGIFLTTNGGANWIRKYHQGTFQNPYRIYFFNKDLGFAARGTGTGFLLRTTDGGETWEQLSGRFTDIHFIDSLTGWKSRGNMMKSTNAGLDWIEQELPQGQPIIISSMRNFSIVNSDTLWGVGGTAYGGTRGIIYTTTDGGTNWGYQLPDATFNINTYYYCKFVDKNYGWAYHTTLGGVHTKKGGDTTYYTTSISQVGTNIPADFILHQNYPNPFNPLTKIKYELKTGGAINMKVYDIRGREVSSPVDETQHPGVYEVNFSASEYGLVLSSGVYFYSLFVDDRRVDTKKMLLIK